MKRLMAMWVALLFLGGCATAAAGAECRQRINDCIRGCPVRLDIQTQDREVNFGVPDTRTDCERQCHQICYP